MASQLAELKHSLVDTVSSGTPLAKEATVHGTGNVEADVSAAGNEPVDATVPTQASFAGLLQKKDDNGQWFVVKNSVVEMSRKLLPDRLLVKETVRNLSKLHKYQLKIDRKPGMYLLGGSIHCRQRMKSVHIFMV